MCNNGLRKILNYDFLANKYLMLSFVNGVDENGIKLSQLIQNHPEDRLQLHGRDMAISL
jgi:hypothetical protein